MLFLLVCVHLFLSPQAAKIKILLFKICLKARIPGNASSRVRQAASTLFRAIWHKASPQDPRRWCRLDEGCDIGAQHDKQTFVCSLIAL